MRYLGIAIEGLPFILFCAFVSLVFALLHWPKVAIIALFCCGFCLQFFRDPERVTPQEFGLAISPADGQIIAIAPKNDPILNESRLCISIFMNVFNVHVNRMPVTAKIEKIAYFPGKFFNASLDKASTDNERCAYLLREEAGQSWIMVQIAGLVARRIVCKVKEGDHLERGQRYGLIRFGSRVDLYLPNDYTPTSKVGDKVYAGQTILAQLAQIDQIDKGQIDRQNSVEIQKSE